MALLTCNDKQLGLEELIKFYQFKNSLKNNPIFFSKLFKKKKLIDKIYWNEFFAKETLHYRDIKKIDQEIGRTIKYYRIFDKLTIKYRPNQLSTLSQVHPQDIETFFI